MGEGRFFLSLFFFSLVGTGTFELINMTSNLTKLEKPVSLVWGCALTAEKSMFTFDVSDEKYEHQLALRTICLGAEAKDEVNIIEILPKEEQGPDAKPVPIASLKASIMPMVSMLGIELTPPVTFRLKAGSGPVYISGQHVALEDDDHTWDEDAEEEEEAEEEELEEEEVSPPPKVVKRPATNKKSGVAKVGQKKMEKEDMEEEMPSTEDDSPQKKGKPAGRGKKVQKS
ncbi:nucleoplasmin-2 isoform X2 [Protopterus annectens]|uniref:nucleoplasmin-2 isoform X2 n=1 Tax=Protopterus annectens TaxID=7888 RepID=UPI001CFB0D75|nr:nucleoplasmin-2 isoform X2 [Protopterus annectens]